MSLFDLWDLRSTVLNKTKLYTLHHNDWKNVNGHESP
jgi:hypothetical protein